jgi:hypothetical protein
MDPPLGQSRVGCRAVSGVPLLAGGSPEADAQRQPVSMVSALSGHLGLSCFDFDFRAGTRRDLAWPALDTSSNLVNGSGSAASTAVSPSRVRAAQCRSASVAARQRPNRCTATSTALSRFSSACRPRTRWRTSRLGSSRIAGTGPCVGRVQPGPHPPTHQESSHTAAPAAWHWTRLDTHGELSSRHRTGQLDTPTL